MYTPNLCDTSYKISIKGEDSQDQVFIIMLKVITNNEGCNFIFIYLRNRPLTPSFDNKIMHLTLQINTQ